MSYKSSKHRNVSQLTMVFDGGINAAQSGTNINDNQLQVCQNFVYANNQSFLTVRNGVVINDVAPVTDDGENLPIDKLHYYVKDASTSWLVAAIGGNLYYLDDDAWTLIGALTGTGITPCMLTYGGKLIVADGGTSLRYWDGTTYGTISGSPQYATALAEIGGRLVANSKGTGEWDGVFFSKLYDETGWDSNNGAVTVRAGYKDALNVVAFGVMGTDLIVFKNGHAKRVYRVTTSGATSTWTVSLLMSSSTASEADSVASVVNDLVFADDFGLNSVQAVNTYGDFAQAMLGVPINSLLNGKQSKELTFSPVFGMLFALFSGSADIYVYHPHNGAFTTINVGELQINSICDTRTTVYLAAQNGHLYQFVDDDADQLTTGVTTYIPCWLKSKSFTFPGEVVIRRSRAYVDVLTPNSGTLAAVGRDNYTETPLFTWEPSADSYIYNATGYIYDALEYIGGESIGYNDSKARWRDAALCFVLRITRGRINIKNILVDLALVNG